MRVMGARQKKGQTGHFGLDFQLANEFQFWIYFLIWLHQQPINLKQQLLFIST